AGRPNITPVKGQPEERLDRVGSKDGYVACPQLNNACGRVCPDILSVKKHSVGRDLPGQVSALDTSIVRSQTSDAGESSVRDPNIGAIKRRRVVCRGDREVTKQSTI